MRFFYSVFLILSFFSIQTLGDVKNSDVLISDHISFLKGEEKFKEGNYKEAEDFFKSALSQDPNALLKNKTGLYQVQILLYQKKFNEALRRIKSLERKLRGNVDHPQSLYLLADVQRSLNQTQAFCKSVRKLYSRYPSFSEIRDWGLMLSRNQFKGKKIPCSATTQDMRQRIRFLQFAGESEKLKAELSEAREGNYFTPSEWISTEVAYLVSEGEVDRGLRLLAQNYSTLKNNFGFLNQLASVAARAGEGALAIGSYYKAYRLAPKSQKGREALFQSAFLSYQFQDYDGATLKFSEFLQKFPRSKLSRDAAWQLAWIQYLKSDFSGAILSFNKLARARGQRQLDRIHYWTAMSHYRMGRPELAYPIFFKLSKKKYLDFYSEASSQRLIKIEKKNTRQPKLAEKLKLDLDTLKKVLNSQMLMLPPEDVFAVQHDEYRDELDELPTLLESALDEVEVKDEELGQPST